MFDVIVSLILGTWIPRFISQMSNKSNRQEIINHMKALNNNNKTPPSSRNVLFSRFRLVSRANRLAVATHRESGAEVHLYEEDELEQMLRNQQDEFQIRLCNQRDPEDSTWVFGEFCCQEECRSMRRIHERIEKEGGCGHRRRELAGHICS